MAEFSQPDFDFSGDFLAITVHAASVPRLIKTDEEKEPAVEEKETKAESFGFDPVTRGKVTDYSAFPANRIYIANEKTILKSNAPPWTPPFDQDFMRLNAFMPLVIKYGDAYRLAASHNLSKMLRLSLDGLAAAIKSEYQDKLMEAAYLLTKNVLPRRRETLNTYLLEQGLSSPETTQKKLCQWIAETNREKQMEKDTSSMER